MNLKTLVFPFNHAMQINNQNPCRGENKNNVAYILVNVWISKIAAQSLKIIVKYHHINVSDGSKLIMMLECSDQKAKNKFANKNQNGVEKK
ncbi:unnamed protein product [Paramecium pentaurelia]|uniref:Uncharacterized protein n=1 Tax=Paramecium pentaurelia TaxID=43138 RepID=A0A8S1V022_9CILI|nr:unnamed protein product [Paramecium pentaurelia]